MGSGFRVIELFILLGLIVFIANVIHYVINKDGKGGGGIFFLSEMWLKKDKGRR